MAETITLPGGKKVPRNVVLIGGATAAGVLGYAWWRKGMGTGTLVGEPAIVPTPVEPPTDSTDFTVTGGGTPAPTSNAEWTNLAIERMIALGFDGTAVNVALGQYLGHQPLTATQMELVRSAIAQAGPPPVGGPYNFIPVAGAVQPPGTGQLPAGIKPGAVTGLKMVGHTRQRIQVAWNKPANASSYNVDVAAGSPEVLIRQATVTRETYTLDLGSPHPDRPYRFRVRARANNGQLGGIASIVARTAR